MPDKSAIPTHHLLAYLLQPLYLSRKEAIAKDKARTWYSWSHCQGWEDLPVGQDRPKPKLIKSTQKNCWSITHCQASHSYHFLQPKNFQALWEKGKQLQSKGQQWYRENESFLPGYSFLLNFNFHTSSQQRRSITPFSEDPLLGQDRPKPKLIKSTPQNCWSITFCPASHLYHFRAPKNFLALWERGRQLQKKGQQRLWVNENLFNTRF